MPPRIQDGSESPISSAIPFQAAPQTAPTIFKHLVPFTELSPTPLSNIEVSIPARHQSTRDPHTSNSSTISSAVTGSTTPISSSSRETRSIRLNNKPRTRTRPPDSRTKSKKGCVAGTPGFQTANSETGSKDQPSIYPKSRRQEFIPPFPPCSERSAVRDLLAEIKSRDTDQSLEQPSFIEFDLSDFSIYLPDNKNYPYELRGLQHLVTRAGCSSFLFDGILTVGNTHRYVSAVPFQICSIGNYGENIHEVDGDIWLQSNINADADIYYRLKTPSPEYREYHDGFLWLANLAKHFVDYCQAAPEQTVFLINFRTDFSQWLREHHGSSPAFQNWYQQYDKDDFRRHITMHIKFLFKETVGVNPELKTEPIFNEVLEMDYIPQQLIVERKTIVTPYVYECFKDLRFGHHLKAMEVSGTPRTQQISQGGCLDLTVNDYVRPSHIEVRVEIPSSIPEPAPRIIQTRSPSSPNAVSPRQRMILNIKSGDVLSVVKDGKGSVWKDEVSRWKTADDCWYVYVQAIHKSTDGTREFDALWLYKASDTSCAKMKYPYQNELFLSDNCTCLQKRITEEEVLSSVKVVWNGRPSERDKRVFIRQTYLENEKFVTLKKAHKRCKHLQAKAGGDPTSHEYQIGQTVLVPPPRKSKFALEPYEVVKFITEGVKEEVAVLRRLQRRQTVDGKGRPNELVYTETLDRIPVRKIEGSCLVRFYKCSDVLNHQIPAPYSRDGTGNAFYITTRLVDVNGIGMVQPIEHNLPASLLQGFDPTEAYARLRGMDLYCGGGNFGRGLEEGGAVHNEWAVDVNREAIYTYFANLPNPNGTKIFFGSVDDLLSQALQGNPKNSNLIPAPGDVDCIFAGSPCQGFSAINSSRNNEQGLKNQSLVASVGAYIDFYRPKYGILENVMTMAQKGRGRDEDVLSQLICAIVGLGYQLQMFVVDAWSCGMPQSRTRLFVSFAAPGLEPLDHPKISHSHPPVKERDRTLGKMANGEAFGRRFRGPTPFEYISAEEGIGELPSIGYGSTYHCTEYPYHISAFPMTERRRQQVESIPKLPRGMNFAKAWNEGRGVLTPEQTSYFPVYRSNGTLRENCSKTSTAWGRMDPKGLITVILSQMAMGDARAGQIIHWDQPRTLTVMEAQRAQGFLDDEILLGGTAASFKILGNSVARGVALALGLALHEAWFKNTPDTSALSVSSSPMIVANVERPKGRRTVSPVITRRSMHVIGLNEASLQGHEDLTSRTLSEEESSKSEDNDTTLVEINNDRPNIPREDDAPITAIGHQRSPTTQYPSTAHFLSDSSATRSRNTAREIRASTKSSDGEEDVSDMIRSQLGLPDEGLPSAASGLSSTSGNHGTAKSLKRPLDILMGGTSTRSHGKSKMPRIEHTSLPMSSSQDTLSLDIRPRVLSPSRNGQDKVLDATILARKLSDLQKSLPGHNRQYYAHPPSRADHAEQSGDKSRFFAATSSNVAASKINQNQRKALPNAARRKTISKPPSKPSAVINLLSDDEEEEVRPHRPFRYPPPPLPSVKKVEEPGYPPQRGTYVPVDNDAWNPYAQTNQHMNFGVKRKHGPKSSW